MKHAFQTLIRKRLNDCHLVKTNTRSHKIIPFSNNETIKFRIEYQNICRPRVESNLLINENFSTRAH